METVGYERLVLCGGADGFGSCLTGLFYWRLLCLGLGLPEASSGEPLTLDVFHWSTRTLEGYMHS